jgi:predicted ATPase/class 3 adenylate cyclase
MDVAGWLAGLGLERYAPAFAENDVDGDTLRRLTAEDLAALGIASVGHRRRLLDAIAALGAERPKPDGSSAEGTATAGPPAARSGAERRQLTVMFVDLVGSTALTSRLDPEEMREVIRAYQNAVAGEVGRFDGHVAKFMGDGVLAYFGWPRSHEDEAERAVRAGLAITCAVARLAAPDGGRLAARIGIATGLVVVGDLVGEGAAQEEAVIGETPNLAARLQGLAEPGAVVIAQGTRQLVGRLFDLTDMGAHVLKGFAEPVRAWAVSREGAAESRFEALHGASLTPLVGREHELGLLLERFQHAREGEGQVVLISGEPGIGKSRAVSALRERLRGEPYMLLGHFCSAFHTNSALQPVIGMLERTAEFASENPPAERLAKLEALLALAGLDATDAVPLLAALLSIPVGTRYPASTLLADGQKRRTLELLVDLVAGLARRQPVLAVFEDLHWVDPSTLELLGLLVDRAVRLPVLLVMTFRPEFQPPWAALAHVTPLPLGRLARRQGVSMIAAIAGDRPLPPALLDQIAAKTDGIPLFVEELTKTLLESGQLGEDDGRNAETLPALAIPTTLQDSLVARLDRLGPAKETAQLGAALGREFSYEMLAAVSPLGESKLNDALDQIVGAGMLFRHGSPHQASYSFKHALVQDAAYAGLLKSRRQQIHSRIAQVLEERFADRVAAQPELLAHHRTEAGEASAAVEAWIRAGARAAERSANAEAVAHLRHGLETLAALPDSEERARHELALQIALGVALIATRGYGAEAIAPAYDRARELCERLGDRDRLLPVLYGQCATSIVAPDCRRAIKLAEEFLHLAESRGAHGPALVARRLIGFSQHNLGDFPASRDSLEQVVANYVPERDRTLAYQYGQDPRPAALGLLSMVYWKLGYPERSARAATEAIAHADAQGHANTVGYTQAFAGCIRNACCRDWPAAREQATTAVAHAERYRLSLWLGWAKFILDRALAEFAPTDAAVAEMRQTLAQINIIATRAHRTFHLTLLAETHGRLGQTEAGLAALEEALARVEKTGERWWEAEIHRVKGELLRARNAAEAEVLFERALAIARGQSAKSLELRAAMSLARLRQDQGRRADGRAVLEPVFAWFTEGFATTDLVEARGLLEAL